MYFLYGTMTEKDIQRVREFNRFYTNLLGLLDRHILESDFSLPEARVLYELYHERPCSATRLLEKVNMDKGYLSRVLKQFEKRGLLVRKPDKTDGRAAVLSLTAKGEREFVKINEASAHQLHTLYSALSASDQRKIIGHMEEIQKLLERQSG